MSLLVQLKIGAWWQVSTVSVTFHARDARPRSAGRMQKLMNHLKNTRKGSLLLRRFTYTWRRVTTIKSITPLENVGTGGRWDQWVGVNRLCPLLKLLCLAMTKTATVVQFMNTDLDLGHHLHWHHGLHIRLLSPLRNYKLVGKDNYRPGQLQICHHFVLRIYNSIFYEWGWWCLLLFITYYPVHRKIDLWEILCKSVAILSSVTVPCIFEFSESYYCLDCFDN